MVRTCGLLYVNFKIFSSRAVKRLVRAHKLTRDLWLNIGGLNDVFEVDGSQGRVPIFLSCMRTAHAGPQWRVARVRLCVRGCCCCNFTSHQVWSAVRLDDLQRCPELRSSCACLLVFGSRPVARMHLSGIAWGSRCTSGGFCCRPRAWSGCCARAE